MSLFTEKPKTNTTPVVEYSDEQKQIIVKNTLTKQILDIWKLTADIQLKMKSAYDKLQLNFSDPTDTNPGLLFGLTQNQKVALFDSGTISGLMLRKAKLEEILVLLDSISKPDSEPEPTVEPTEN